MLLLAQEIDCAERLIIDVISSLMKNGVLIPSSALDRSNNLDAYDFMTSDYIVASATANVYSDTQSGSTLPSEVLLVSVEALIEPLLLSSVDFIYSGVDVEAIAMDPKTVGNLVNGMGTRSVEQSKFELVLDRAWEMCNNYIPKWRLLSILSTINRNN
jgi:hypothetical protein